MQPCDTHENVLLYSYWNCVDLVMDLGDQYIEIFHNAATHISNVLINILTMYMQTLLPYLSQIMY